MKQIRNSRKYNFIRLSFLLLGIALILYPVISNFCYNYAADFGYQIYQNDSKSLDEAQKTAEIQKAQAYNTSLNGQYTVDPFSASRTIDQGITDNYYSILNIDALDYNNLDGIMGYLEIPRIGETLPVFHGISEDRVSRGVGHIPGTSLPIGGKGTHAVIGGHNAIPGVKLFTDLYKLKPGDQFYITVLDQKLAYQVVSVEVVKPDDTSWYSIDPDADEVTLLTCTPYGINDHRLLVHALRTSYNPETQAETRPATDWYMIATLAAVIGLVTAAVLQKKKNRTAPKR